MDLHTHTLSACLIQQKRIPLIHFTALCCNSYVLPWLSSRCLTIKHTVFLKLLGVLDMINKFGTGILNFSWFFIVPTVHKVYHCIILSVLKLSSFTLLKGLGVLTLIFCSLWKKTALWSTNFFFSGCIWKAKIIIYLQVQRGHKTSTR